MSPEPRRHPQAVSRAPVRSLRQRASRWLAPLAVGIVGALSFAASLPDSRFVFDDHVLVEANMDLRRSDVWWVAFARDYYTTSAQVGRSGYYRPVAVLTHAADVRVWGKKIWGHRFTNLVLHAAASAALVPALVALGAPGGVAVLAGLLFAVHPAHAESVAFISGRVDVLAGLGVFVALAFAGAASSGAVIGVAVAALFAFLSKEIAVVLPLLVFLVWRAGRQDESSLEKRPPSGRALVLAVGLAGAVSLLMRWAALATFLPLTASAPRPAGAALLPLQSFAFALASLYVPVKRLLMEPQADQLALARLGAGIVVAAILWWTAWRVDRETRPFLRRCAWAGAIALIPVLNLLPQETRLSERFLYVSSGFWLAPVAVLVGAGWRRGGAWRPASAGACALAAVLLLGISAWRARAWRDDVVLWRIAVREEPDRVAFWDRLGLALTERRDFGPAESALRRAVGLDPRYFNAQVNLGVLLHMTHRPREAIEAYRVALGIDPKHVNTHLNIGLAMLDIGQMAEAYQEFATAAALKPDNPDALRLAGGAAVQIGRHADGRRYLEAARRILPEHPAIQQAFRVLEEAEGRQAETRPAP